MLCIVFFPTKYWHEILDLLKQNFTGSQHWDSKTSVTTVINLCIYWIAETMQI